MNDPGRSAKIHALIFTSGASSLAFELVWIRALGLHFGTTVGAITTVIATFTAGLALGSVALGRTADRSASPLRLYGNIELAIGASATAVSMLILHGAGALAPLARAAVAAGPFSGVVRAITFFVILLLPTTLMGGTLPALARVRTHAHDGGKSVGRLYAFNTLGAVVGALVPDGFLIPSFGLTFTTLVAAVGNLVVALVARSMTDPAPPPEPARVDVKPVGGERVALVLFAVSGFCAMGYEVLWSRVLEHLVEGLAIGFSVLLAVYLVAVAIGSHLTSARADRAKEPLVWASLCLSASGLFAFLPLAAIVPWARFLEAHVPRDSHLARQPESYWWTISLFDSIYLEAISCLFMGMAFPFLAALCVRGGVAGRTSARLYATNTVAGVLGSFAAGFLVLPAFGVERGFLLLTSSAVVLGAVALFATTRARDVRVASGAMVCAAIALGVAVPENQFRSAFLSGPSPEYVREGTTTSVAVVSHATFDTPTWRELKMPGVSMSDTRFSSRRYMGLMAHLPMLFARRHDDALLICFGVGNSARSLLSHPDLAHLDVVDISREVLGASPHFAQVTSGDPLTDPRVRVIVDDGRHHLITTDRTYDVITSEPPPPNHVGVVNLYAREYYRAARRVLRPGGVLAQWLPVLQLSPKDIREVVGAIAAEFPHVELRYGFGQQWILLGSDAPFAIDDARWEAALAEPSVARDLASIGVRDAADLIATYMQGDAALREVARGASPVEDDLPSIEYPIEPIALPIALPEGLVGDPMDGLRIVRGASAASMAEAADASRAMAIVLRAMPLRAMGPPETYELAFGTIVRGALRLRPSHPAILALLDVDDVLVGAARARLAGHPEDGAAAFVLARRAYYDDAFADADARLATMTPAPAVAARYWLLRGGCARALGKADDAAAAFDRAAKASRDPRFQSVVEKLARAGSTPWDPMLGPLGLSD